MNRNQLIGHKFPVLDQGFVYLVDVMGDDSSVVQAARVSFGKGTKSVSDDRTLLRFLMRHRHETPFEMAEVKLHVRVPMDVWRQWIRHRTANVNEYSTRYSEAIDAMHATPVDGWRIQSSANKQGSGGALNLLGHSTGIAENLCLEETELQRHARKVYEHRLGCGVAREQARKDLPLSTYTEAYWKCDLRNVLHFLGLRMDSHAQWEIRQYADVIGNEIIKPLFPLCWEAFLDYRLHAVTLSRLDVETVRKARVAGCLAGGEIMERYFLPDITESALGDVFANTRERDECRDKLRRLGLL